MYLKGHKYVPKRNELISSNILKGKSGAIHIFEIATEHEDFTYFDKML